MTDQTQQSIRLRVVEFVIMADDGETLTPSPCQPVTVPGNQVAGFPAEFAAQLLAEEERLNSAG